MPGLISLPPVARMIVPHVERARLKWETVICDQYQDDRRPMDPTCGDCSYCCWAYRLNIPMPDEIGRPGPGLWTKNPMEMCSYLFFGGKPDTGKCRIHSHSSYPAVCEGFECAYLKREREEKVKDEYGRVMNFRFHRPEAFRQVISEMAAVRGTIFPAVPSHIPIDRAVDLIRETTCLPVVDGHWQLRMVA